MVVDYPDQNLLDEIRVKLRAGRPVDALRLADGRAPLDKWIHAGPRAAFMASRLYSWLGNDSRSDAIARVARRLYPDDAEIFLIALSNEGRLRGVLSELRLVEDRSKHPELDIPQQVLLATVRADFYTNWSDFSTAFRIVDEAERLRPGHARTAICRARILTKADRREEAMEVLREVVQQAPFNVSAPRKLAELLMAQGKDDEGLAVLDQAMTVVQDFDIQLARANWHSERKHYEESLQLSKEFEFLQPLASHSLKTWMAGWRAFRHYLNRDYPQALREAAKAPKCFISELAPRLEAATEGRRVQLEVPFVKQDRRTCAPATLAAICRYWGDAAEHVEIAEAICYDGTPDHSERNWADEHGYHVREFCVTPETVRALIDRGIPFTLTTVEPASAHLQAVIGYDSTADTVLVREPGWAEHAEYRMKFLEDYKFSGPRGMILLPKEKLSLLEGITLLEAELYDLLHRMQRLLHENNREAAVEQLEALRAAAPGHRLALIGQRTLTQYDGNPRAQLEVYESMLALFPDQPALLYGKMRLLHSTAGRGEQIAFAKRLIATDKAPHEVRRELADLLDDDARDWPEAERAWQKAIVLTPYNAATMSGYADLKWSQMQRVEAAQYYRFAACIEILSEYESQTYFNTSVWLGKEAREEALEFLKERVAKHGALSGQPARTLVWALQKLHRSTEALEVLETAMKLRPDDGPLLLEAADTYRLIGQQERAGALLQSARQLIKPAEWLRRAATDAISRAELAEAIAHYRTILEQEPLNRNIHASLANLLAGTSGRAAALAHLETFCQANPGNSGLHTLLVDWLEENPARKLEVVQHLLKLNPGHAWAWRELALLHKEERRHDEAVVAAREALRVEPWSCYSHGILADVLNPAGQTSEALELLRKSLTIDADYAWAITELVHYTPTLEGRRSALLWIISEMQRQVINGEGLARWQEEAWPILEPEEVLKVLESVKLIRPDLWQVWSTLGLHLRSMGRFDESLAICEGITKRFPFLPRSWFDLAVARSRQGDILGEKEALEQALSINPDWLTAVRRVAGVCETLEDISSARRYLEAHHRRNPLDGGALFDLIALLRKIGAKDEAFEAAQRGVLLLPLRVESWTEFAKCARRDKVRESKVEADAAALTDAHPNLANAWEARASVAAVIHGYAAELKVLTEALVHFPQNWDFLDRKALLLAEYGRYEEALECCSTDDVPKASAHYRQARRADILNRKGSHHEAIHAMESILEHRPDYVWGVARVLEWHDHMANPEAVLKWASHYVRIAPSNAVAHGFQADALLHLKREDEAEASLRRAILLDPGYVFAARKLLELELKRRDFDAAARTVARVRGRVAVATLALIYKNQGHAQHAADLCRSAVEQDASDWRNHNGLGEALWEIDQKTQALEAFCAAAKLNPLNGDLAENLAGKAKTIQQVSEVEATLKAWVHEDLKDPQRHTFRCNFLNAEPGSPSHLLALDEAIAHLEQPEDFVDLKVLALCRQRRYTDGLELCAKYDSTDEPNAMIRRRKAWLEAERGQREAAISLMMEALKMDPENVFGLRRICDWLEQEQRYTEAVSYAEQLVQANPEEAASFGYLASALMKCNRNEEAEPYLKRAFRMQDEYAWASNNLFRLQMARKDFGEAEITLRMIQEHQPGPDCLVKRIQMESARGNAAEAFNTWNQLLDHKVVELFHLKEAEGLLQQAGWESQLDAAWMPRTASEMTDIQLEAWMTRNCEAGRARIWRQLGAIIASETALNNAWAAYFRKAGNTAKANGTGPAQLWLEETNAAIRRYKNLFKANDQLWGWIAWFCTCTDQYFKGRRWVADWKTRAGLEGWMTVNVAVLMEGRWRPAGAVEIREWALANVPIDHGSSFHRATLASVAAGRGELEKARHHIANIRMEDFSSTRNPREMKFRVQLASLVADLQDPSIPIKSRRTAASIAFQQAVKDAGGGNLSNQTFRAVFWAALKHGGISKFSWLLLQHAHCLFRPA